MYEEFLEIIDQKAEELGRLSDAIWDAPETAFEETVSAGLLVDYLKKEGFTITMPYCGIATAFAASYGSGKPVIGLLGEFDALAGLSQVADAFEKKALVPGAPGHGCGHNMLGVGSIAAALAVKKYLEAGHEGTVIYYGCPGEEGGSGKAFMAREGVFSDLDCALTWHPGELNQVAQYTSLANIQVLYRFYGTSAHASSNPEDGRSALDAVELMNVGTNFLREHMGSDCRIHYALINNGGFSPNVVQAYASVLYLIRAPKVSDVQKLFARVNRIAEGMAMATETRVEYDIIKSCANLVPNRVLEEQLHCSLCEIPMPAFSEEELAYAANITAAGGSDARPDFDEMLKALQQQVNIDAVKQYRLAPLYDFVVPYESKLQAPLLNGSTDVGDVSWQCPTAQINTCTWAPLSGGHSWQIVSQGKGSIAHKATLYSGKVLGLTAIRLMKNPEALASAKAEFADYMKDKEYVPIPKGIMPRSIASLN